MIAQVEATIQERQKLMMDRLKRLESGLRFAPDILARKD